MYCETLEHYIPSDTEVYMNPRQQEYFKQLLLMHKDDLKAGIALSRVLVQNMESRTSDSIDLSCTETKIRMELIAIERYQRKLFMVRTALERIDKGTFGYCILTGSEIGIKRLKILPCATLSVDAQEILESLSKRMSCSEQKFTFDSSPEPALEMNYVQY